VRVIRCALGDNGRRQRIIQTIHGKGYRFIAPVEVATADAQSQPEPPTPVAASAAPGEAPFPPIRMKLTESPVELPKKKSPDRVKLKWGSRPNSMPRRLLGLHRCSAPLLC
jgi:hypothetical protein